MKKRKSKKAKDEVIPRANYGSNEGRRTCHICGSPSSHVIGTRVTGRLIIRYRQCDDCGTKRTTQEVIPA